MPHPLYYPPHASTPLCLHTSTLLLHTFQHFFPSLTSFPIFAPMENFIVSARKYRPQAFDQVVGQQHVTNTLLNAINQNHLAQALLFTGPRGVGKTTCARILAKMINSEEAAESDQDFSFNIFELDAASNNSVDDIRNLIDQVRFAPQVGHYKVYIIDEVHMLSQQAFNAFLKTLEEPPKHAIFILATTEKHKIIPTILSRCQIYDFKRITVEDIAAHLRHVAEKENIKVENEALHIIAQKADGALRDALSIFDRIVSFSGDEITYQDVIDNLRILDYDYYFRTTDLIMQGDRSGLLLIFDEILDNGFDGHLFINGLASHFRDLLVCKDPRTLDLLEVGERTRDRYKQQAQAVDANFLLRGLKLCGDVDVKYKGSNNPRLLVELCLLQLAELATGEPVKKKSAQPSEPVARQPEKATPKNAPKIITPAPSQAKEEPKPAPKHEPEVIEAKGAEPPQEKKKETPAAPKPTGKGGFLEQKRKRRSKLSITGTLSGEIKEENDEEEVDDTAPNPELPKDEFDETRLTNIWNEYLEIIKSEGKQRIFSSLSNKKLKLEENFTVMLLLENDIQVDFFNEEKAELLRFMREKLNNYSLQFRIEKTRQTQTLEPYSAQEKYEYMVKKNPHLQTLRKLLDLDVE